jgi:DNA-binding CsgD family transcriptional regulator
LDDSPVVLAEAVLRLLTVLADGQGGLLVLEDLHWADPESLAVVEYLADNLGGEPVVCLGTVRSEEASAGLELVRGLRARRAARVLELPRLDVAAVAGMVAACLPSAPTALGERVVRLADGVPFLVEELLAAQAASGWTADRPDSPALPDTFVETVVRRTQALGDDARVVLAVAALLGRRFDWRLLPQVTGLDEEAVVVALERATAAQLLAADGDGFRFRHALTREAVLDGLLPPRRVALAARALAAVEALHPGLPGGWCDLAAELAEAAGSRERAAELLLDSGRRSLARDAIASATAALRRARALAARPEASGEISTALLAEIEEALVEAAVLAGDSGTALELSAELLARLAAMGAPTARRAQAHARRAGAAITAGRWDLAADQVEQARRLAGGDGGLEARLGALAAAVALGRGQPAEAEVLAQAALDRAEVIGLPEVACRALELLGRCARVRDLGAAEAAFDRAREVAEGNGLRWWQVRALHELGTIELLDRAGTGRLQEARELAEEDGALATVAVVDLQLAAAHAAQGDAAGTLEAARRAEQAARRFRLGAAVGLALGFQAGAHAFLGDRAAMEDAAGGALAAADGDPTVPGAVWGARSLCSLVDDDRPRALEELRQAMGFLRLAPTTAPAHYRGLWALLETLADAGRGAAACAEVVASGVLVNRINRGFLAYAEAVEAGRAGRPAEAAAAVARGEAELDHADWFRQLGRRLLAGAALAGGWGEPVAWLREAATVFQASGHPRLAAACRAQLGRAGAPVPRKGRGEAAVPPALRGLGVTSREAEVLGLVGEGLSNREIAARLYLSPRTVEKHVESLQRKTGITGRARLAVFAAGATAVDWRPARQLGPDSA